MSPSEFQLRAALHHGEGDAPDPDRLIAHAVGVRRERRRRINVAVGSAAAVALVGLCAGVLIAYRGTGETGGASAGYAGRAALSAGAAASGSAGGSSVAGGTTGASSRPAGVAVGGAGSSPAGTGTYSIGSQCPVQPDRFMVPGGGGSGQFGSTEAIFGTDVISLRVCGYPLQATAQKTSALVEGASAKAIITELNSASATRINGGQCTDNVGASSGTIELIGITSSGTVTRPVVISVACPSSQATNGTAVRYLRSVPEVLLRLVKQPALKSTAGVGTPTR